MTTIARRAWPLLLLLPLVVNAQDKAPGQTMLVLDASGSMWGQVGGRAKVEVARDAVSNMLTTWPKGEHLGLMAYGHRRKGDCADIEVISLPALVDSASFKQKVNNLQPKGMTPISASVRMAAEQLKFSQRKTTVILVSDGEETCQADPCALGKELEAAGVDFTAHVIGFDLPAGPARAQLQCLASSTGGTYIEARNAADLKLALGTVAQVKAPPPAPSQSVRFEDGCIAYDQENFKGAAFKLGGLDRGRMRELPDGWSKRIKSMQCAPTCGVMAFAAPGYDGDQIHVEPGAKWAKMPADYGGSFGSYDLGCTAIIEAGK